MNYKILLLGFALALLLPFATSASSNIDINVSPAVYYLKGPQTITFNFNFINLRDDDSAIDRVDFYILDLKAQNINFIAYTGSNWQHEYLAKFDDEHFWITSASGQSLNVTLSSNFTTEGEYHIQGYYQFFDQTGSMVGLGDNRPLFPLVDVIDHVFAKIIIDKTPPTISISEPSWTSEGLKIQASINDSNPIASVKLSYNSPSGNKTIDANYSTTTKTAIMLIPLSDIKEGTKLTTTITAIDAAGNSGNASKEVNLLDNPQINNIYPSTLLPQTIIKLFAKITDSSGVKEASVKFTQNSKNEKTLQMIKGEQDFWSADLGSFEKGTRIDYTITASDTLGNPATTTGYFTILNDYTVKFKVIDAVLKTQIKGITLTVSSRTVTSFGTNFIIPEKTLSFDDSTSFQQIQGSYYFSFTTANYPEHKYLFDIQSDFEKTIMLGSGARSEIREARINPRLSDNNKSYYLDIIAVVQEAYPVKSLKLKYSLNSSLYDSEIELAKRQNTEYYAVLGPFQSEIVLYSKLELIDASEQVIIFDLGIRWYNLLSNISGTNIKVEVCSNGKDDNNNGLIDEGCPCNEKDTQTCSKNIGVCKIGVQKCINGKWSETCEGGITPIPEVCGNELDDDCDGITDNGCFIDSDNDGLSDEQEKKIRTNARNPDTDEDNVSDGQEFLKDNTNPLDEKSNLLYVDLKSSLNLEDTQEIRLFHPKLGAISGINAVIITPSGTEQKFSDNNSGVISFKPTEAGNYYAKVSKKKFEAVKEFSVSSGIFSVAGSIGSSVSFVFGETATEAPLYLIFLLILCIVIAIAANLQFKALFKIEKKVLSSSEEKKELIKRTAFVVATAVIPLIILRLSDEKTGFQNSVFVAFALIIILLASGFMISKARVKKGIKVEEKKEPKNIFEKITSNIKALFFEEKTTPDIKPAREWKKIDWQLESPEIKQENIQTTSTEKTDGFQYKTPNSEETMQEKTSFTSFEEPESTKSVQVWKRFEPVEFEDRMLEIGKEVEKTLEKKLLEVGDEIEARVGKKLLEVEEEVDRRVSRRLLETEEAVERKLSRKLAEIEEEVDRKLKKRMQEMEENISKEVEKKLSEEKLKHKKASFERLKKQAAIHKILREELKKTEKLSTPTGFILKETKEPTALSVQTKSIQQLPKAIEEKMQELTRQLAVLNTAFEKGIISQSEFENQSTKIKTQIAELQKQ